MAHRPGHLRVQAVVETTTPKITQGIVTTIHEGSSVIATRAIVTKAAIRATCSAGTLSYRADRTAKSFTMPETVTLSHAPSRFIAPCSRA